MTEEKTNSNVNSLLSKIEEFESTISQLSDNIKTFRVKLLEKKQRYGEDMGSWPENK